MFHIKRRPQTPNFFRARNEMLLRRAFARFLPPHPGPLPEGEGEFLSAQAQSSLQQTLLGSVARDIQTNETYVESGASFTETVISSEAVKPFSLSPGERAGVSR